MAHYGEFNDLFSTRQEIVHEGITRIRPSGDDDDVAEGGGGGGGVFDVEGGGGDDGYSGSEGELVGGGEAGYSDDDDSEDVGSKFVSSYADRERVSAAGGTSDLRLKTPAEKAKQKLTMVFDTEYFSSSDTRLVDNLATAFGDRLPTFNLHTLAATAVWITTEHAETDKVLGDYCKAKRIDPADLLRYQTMIGPKLREVRAEQSKRR